MRATIAVLIDLLDWDVKHRVHKCAAVCLLQLATQHQLRFRDVVITLSETSKQRLEGSLKALMAPGDGSQAKDTQGEIRSDVAQVSTPKIKLMSFTSTTS